MSSMEKMSRREFFRKFSPDNKNQGGPEEVNQPAAESAAKAPREMSRREFLKIAGFGFTAAAIEGCLPITKGLVNRGETERGESLVSQWQRALEAGIKELENNQPVLSKFGLESVEELTNILKNFNIQEYLSSLAELARINQQEIKGTITGFSCELPTEKRGNRVMAEIEDLSNIKFFLNERAQYQGQFHQNTIQAVLRHELAHIFSIDHKAQKESDIVPWKYSSKRKDPYHHISVSHDFYEGSTEVVALLAGQESKQKSLEQGYRGGGALSAFVVSELIGKENFIKAYLKKDPELLGKYLEEKIGDSAHQRLTMPVSVGANLFNPWYDQSLDVLHNVFKHSEEYGYNTEDILSRAWQMGIKEKADYSTKDDSTLGTTHLYMINDADQPPQWAFNGVGEAPMLYRFGKIKDESGYFASTSFSYVMLSRKMEPGDKEKLITAAAEMLRKASSIKDPREFSLVDPHLILGIDTYIKQRLEKLNNIRQDSEEFDKVWQEISEHAQQMSQESVMEVYKQAGVEHLIYKREKDN